MKKYIYIGVGGFLGAISRYLIKGISIPGGSAVVNTLIINVTGSLILALLLTVAFEVWEMDESLRLGIGTGFLGAYTTFSTLCKETAMMFFNGNSISAVTYMLTSVLLGLAAVYLGVVLARELVAKIAGRKNPGNHTDEMEDVV